jgi:uncharacterized protein
MAHEYRVVSADTHLDISPEAWRHRVAAEYRDCAPRLVRLPHTDAMLIEGRALNKMDNTRSGVPYERWLAPGTGMRYEEMAGAGSPEQRVREQELDGVDAEILYPDNGGRGSWQKIADDDAYHAVIRGHNDWLAEEYCSVAPDRLIALGVLPQRDLEKTIAELEHCARLGLKGVDLNAYPNGSLFPKPADDTFWAAAIDLDMPVSVHTNFAGYDEVKSRQLDFGRFLAKAHGHSGAGTAAQLTMAGVFDRFPKLQLFFAENQIGWIPNWLEQMDMLYQQHRFYHERLQSGLAPLSRLPSEIVKAHCAWGFMDNPIGIELRHYIGVDRIMWSNDFPHPPSDWPNSRDTIERNFQGVPIDEKYMMVAGNCIRFFHLDD